MRLALDQVSKSFPGVNALTDATLRLEPGEVHALMGENGAGKSTLIKIVTGVYQPDRGAVLLDGVPVRLPSPRQAIRLGISAVHQERNLVPEFSVAENILLEDLPRRHGLIDIPAIRRLAQVHLDRVGLDIDPATPVKRLSVAQMQMIEIAKALSHRAGILLLDEPTASLTNAEAQILFSLVRSLRDEGTAILFVSHKLNEVSALCDKVTVLRDGRTTLAAAPMSSLSQTELIAAMIGRAERPAPTRTTITRRYPAALELDHVSTALGHRDVNFAVHSGEIVGLYGLVGAGRTELARAILGDAKVTGGEIRVGGRAVGQHSVRDAIKRLRIGYVSEDRKREGVILSQSVRTNIAMAVWERIAGFAGLISEAGEAMVAEPLVRRLDIRTPGVEQLVGKLSGGNQQKVSIAKWLAADVDILLIDEPTVGIDIDAKAQVHQLIYELAASGKAIVLISSEMQEMVAIADRIHVLHEFAVVDSFENDQRYDQASVRIMTAIQAATAKSAAAVRP